MERTTSLQTLLEEKRADILMLTAQHGAVNVRIFGSVAQRKDDATSDIDFLVQLQPGRSLLDLGALLMDLQDLLGRDVDIVTGPGCDRGSKSRCWLKRRRYERHSRALTRHFGGN